MSRQRSLWLSAALLLALPWGASAEEPPRPADAPPARAKQQLYTCPMHPEIQWSQPVNCPLCDMKLIAKRAPAASSETQAHDHAGMSMGEESMHGMHGHSNMGGMSMGGCSMCMKMMGMGDMSGMNGHRSMSSAPRARAARPSYGSYPSGRHARGCGC